MNIEEYENLMAEEKGKLKPVEVLYDSDNDLLLWVDENQEIKKVAVAAFEGKEIKPITLKKFLKQKKSYKDEQKCYYSLSFYEYVVKDTLFDKLEDIKEMI